LISMSHTFTHVDLIDPIFYLKNNKKKSWENIK
jgi:hypothetical protein